MSVYILLLFIFPHKKTQQVCHPSSEKYFCEKHMTGKLRRSFPDIIKDLQITSNVVQSSNVQTMLEVVVVCVYILCGIKYKVTKTIKLLCFDVYCYLFITEIFQ